MKTTITPVTIGPGGRRDSSFSGEEESDKEKEKRIEKSEELTANLFWEKHVARNANFFLSAVLRRGLQRS